MTPEHKENEEFAKWVRDGIAVIEQKSDPVEGKLAENTASADEQKHSDVVYPLTPKLRAEPGRFAT